MRTGVDKKVENTKKLTTEQALALGRDSVADALTYLTSASVQNFYARVITLMDRIPVPGLGTMAVSAHRGHYLFLYDPLFAATVSYEELCATCEHEVMHLILEHIPRYLSMKELHHEEEDKHLFEITANLAMDLADNELIARTWPKLKDLDKKPLGHWVIPEGFDPKLPKDMAYENYQRLLIDLLTRRLDSSPTELYKLARQILKKQSEALQKAMQQQGSGGNSPLPGASQPQPGAQGAGQGQPDPNQQDPGQGAGSAQGQGTGQGQDPGAGDGQGQDPAQSSDPDLTPDELQEKLENLDALDGKILEMLVKSMRPHLAWDHASYEEGDSHKLLESGRELIRTSLSTNEKSRGTIPGHVLELIRKMLTPPSVSWTQLLYNLVQHTRQTKKERGMSRPSKKLSAMQVYARLIQADEDVTDPRLKYFARRMLRMPVFPGIKHNNKYTIVYVVDTSGSMSTKDLQLGLSELQYIQKTDSEVQICVIYADTHVCKEYWLSATGEIDRGMTGRGGTDFELVFQHVKHMLGHSEKAPDIMIYCTDGYAPPPATKLPIPTVWLLTPGGQPIMTETGHHTIFMKNYQLEDAPDV